jgi:MFS transporter, OFA family, oxalate/formate antiporter
MMKKIFYGWWIVLACSIICLYVTGVVFAGFTAFFEPLIKEFGWSYTQISFAMSLRGFEMSFFAPLLGFLVGRFGSRKLILFGIIAVCLGLILFSLTRSLVMFYVSFLLLSFGGGGCAGVVTMTVVANWFQRNVGKAMGVLSSGYGAAGVMIPFVVWLIEAYGWRAALVILGIGVLILGVPLSFVIRDRPETYGYFPDGGLLSDPAPMEGRVQGVEIGFREAIKQNAFITIALVEIMRQAMASSVAIHVMPYLASAGVPRVTAGMVAAGIPLISIVGRLGFGWLGDIGDKKYALAAGFLLTGMGMLAFCYAQCTWAIFAFLLFFSPGFGATMVLERTILREYFGRESFPKILGIIMGAASIGGIIGPTLAGWVFDTLRSYYIVWLLYAGTSGLSVWLILRIRPVNAKAGVH